MLPVVWIANNRDNIQSEIQSELNSQHIWKLYLNQMYYINYSVWNDFIITHLVLSLNLWWYYSEYLPNWEEI